MMMAAATIMVPLIVLWHMVVVWILQCFTVMSIGGGGGGTTTMVAALDEEDRLEEYAKRNYTWPLETYVPNTVGWKILMEHRFAQVAQIYDPGERYEGFMQLMHSTHLVPNFTEYGFGLAKCPDDLTRILQEAIREGLPTAQYERRIEVIDAPEQPLFIARPDLTRRVLHELLPYAEAWSGIELTPYTAYGFRLYQNHSQLTMHVDKMQTHIVSFILHIDSDSVDPWPIVIEDFYGVTHEVVLTPGDLLFYESAKCFHGRPRRLNGKWYSSLFVHYYPKYGWSDIDHSLESHYAVPPIWDRSPSRISPQKSSNPQSLPRLQMVGTSMKEPECKDDWCGLANARRWSGPGKHGYWITPYGEERPLLLKNSLSSTTSDEL